MDGVNDKTMMGWAYCSDFTDTGGIWAMGNPGTIGQDYTLRPDGTTDDWRVNHWGASDYLFTTGTTSLNVWWHFAVTYDGTTSRAYANGAEINSNIVTLNTEAVLGLNIGKWYEGSQPTANLRYFNGRIADVRAYSRTLSADEIVTIYNGRGKDGIVESLEGRWLLNDGSTSTIGVTLIGAWTGALDHDNPTTTISSVAAPSGSNRLMVAFAAQNDGSAGIDLTATTGVQYGGQNFTHYATAETGVEAAQNHIELWALGEDAIVAAASPADLVFDWDTTGSNPSRAVYQYSFFEHVEQTNPVRLTRTATTLVNNSTLSTLAVTAVSGFDMVLEAGSTGTDNNWSALAGSFTLGLDQDSSAGASTSHSTVTGYKTSSGSDTPTLTNNPSPRIAMIGARITAMAGPPSSTFVGGTEATKTSGTALTLSVPAHADGDLLVACIVATNSTTTAPNITQGSWTLIINQDLTSGSPPSEPSMWVFRRTATAEPANYDFSANGTCTIIGHIYCYQNTSTTEDDSVSSLGDSISPSCPSVTTSGGGTFLVIRMIASDSQQIPATPTLTFSNGVNERLTTEATGVGNGCSLAVSDQIRSGATTGTETFALAGADEWGAFTVTFAAAEAAMRDSSGSSLHPHHGDTQNGPTRVEGVLRV